MLKLEDVNYSAVIVQVDNLHDLEGLDKLKGFDAIGCRALVGPDTKIGDIGVFFVSETQLSGEYVKKNNLYRKPEWNEDNSKKGYFEENCRVKAVKFRGNISTGFFMPLSSLDYLNYEFKVGDSFTHVNDVLVCKKYVIKQKEVRLPSQKKVRKVKRTTVKPELFPLHFDTEHYARNTHLFNPDDFIIVTAKLHGTSCRLTNQTVRSLTLLEKISNLGLPTILSKVNKKAYNYINGKYIDTVRSIDDFLRSKIKNYDVNGWKTVAGSRTVTKDNFANSGYYDQDVWTEVLTEFGHSIPKNWVIYGEIIGWTNNRPIQKHYTYCIPQGEKEFYAYRISVVNEDGIQVDLSFDAMKQFCNKIGMKVVPELWRGYHRDFDYKKYMDVRYADMGFNSPRLAPGLNDEGVVVRREGIIPLFLKAKSSSFLIHEGKLLDDGELDIETSESINNDI